MQNILNKNTNAGRALLEAKRLYESGNYYCANLILKGLHGINGFLAYTNTMPFLIEGWGSFLETEKDIKYIPY